MKLKPDGWLYSIAVLVIAGVLFLPVPALGSSPSLLKELSRLTPGSVLAWFLTAVGFWGFRKRFWASDPRESRRLSSGILLVVLQAVLLRILYELADAYFLSIPSWLPSDAWVWVPWFLLPGLAAILIGGRLGVLVCVTGGFMLYLLSDPGHWPLVGCTGCALAGILFLRRSPTRGRVLRAGAAAGAILGIVAGAQYAMQGASIDAISAAVLIPLAIGFLSAILVLALLPMVEWMLGELSDVTLVEYGTDHRLLDELRTQAPGTWHHSLNVADLAEKAAAEIGAGALFCKTAALYHDIGKLKEPALFAENNDGPSPHDQLTPEASARRIIEHVGYGVELARKHRLPQPFREIIAEHHGGSIVRFFYAKASQPLPDGSRPAVDRRLFCYPGPSPSTRESGIIALADVVEAASRSFTSRSEAELQAFVRKLVADRISEGELAECPLTFSDLAKVQKALVVWLKGRNHYRPVYPGTAPVPAEAGLAAAT